MSVRNLKVWTGRYMLPMLQVRAVIAATSQNRVTEVTGIKAHEIENYWSKTASATEIAIATRNPEILMVELPLLDMDGRRGQGVLIPAGWAKALIYLPGLLAAAQPLGPVVAACNKLELDGDAPIWAPRPGPTTLYAGDLRVLHRAAQDLQIACKIDAATLATNTVHPALRWWG